MSKSNIFIPSSKPEAEAKELLFRSKNSLPDKRRYYYNRREKLYAILTNLVKNAIKYTEKGEIEMGYTKGNNLNFVKTQVLALTKTGRQAIIFERFIRLIFLKKPFKAWSLGLAISKAYVELLAGKISMKNEKEKDLLFILHPISQ
jgi:signal transduction histidine kinase